MVVEQKFVRLTLIILTADATTHSTHEEEMLTLAQDIAKYWEPFKKQSMFSLSVTLQQYLLVVTTLFICVAGTVEYTRKGKKKEKNLKIFGQFVPQDEKLIFQSIEKMNNEKGKATTKNIAYAIEQATGKRPTTDKLINTLYHLRENGLIEMDIIEVNDDIQLVWKPRYEKD